MGWWWLGLLTISRGPSRREGTILVLRLALEV